jgi:hypothetical protein
MIPVKVPYENDVVDADEMGFKSTSGTPQVLELEDGSKIKFGHTVSKVFKLRDKKKEDGRPIFICVGNALIEVILPGDENPAEGGGLTS